MFPMFLYASTTPCATRSQRTIPPKMLIKIAFTFGSFKIMWNAFSTRSASAVPPTSKKLAGLPPEYLMISIVAIARPAPFTIQATFPSNFTKFNPASPASTSIGSSSEVSRISKYSG